jgi:hypothetical protein
VKLKGARDDECDCDCDTDDRDVQNYPTRATPGDTDGLFVPDNNERYLDRDRHRHAVFWDSDSDSDSVQFNGSPGNSDFV